MSRRVEKSREMTKDVEERRMIEKMGGILSGRHQEKEYHP